MNNNEIKKNLEWFIVKEPDKKKAGVLRVVYKLMR